MKNNYNIGPVIKNIRSARKLTSEDVGKKIGISGAYIRSIEKGNKLPTIPVLAKICDFFNITLSQLFKKTESLPAMNIEMYSDLEEKLRIPS